MTSPVLASMQRRKDADRKRNKWVCLREFYLLIASISGVDKHVQAGHYVLLYLALSISNNYLTNHMSLIAQQLHGCLRRL